jgi:hypothetical protein
MLFFYLSPEMYVTAGNLAVRWSFPNKYDEFGYSDSIELNPGFSSPWGKMLSEWYYLDIYHIVMDIQFFTQSTHSWQCSTNWKTISVRKSEFSTILIESSEWKLDDICIEPILVVIISLLANSLYCLSVFDSKIY